MQTVLLLGGAGYVGSSTARRLLAEGYGVVILDSLVHQQVVNIPGAIILQGDYADAQLLRSIFSSYTISIVMHFASLIEVGLSVKEPAAFYENNVIKTKRLLDQMIIAGAMQLVFSSSCAVYRPLKSMEALTEEHDIGPISPYGKTKYMVECLLQDYAYAYGLRYVALRYFNAAGATIDDGYCMGEQHTPETHLIPQIFQAVTEKRPVAIFGNNYATPDGTCVRDYVHISDLASAHFLALKYLDNPAHSSQAFNIGSGKGVSVAEVVATVSAICGQKIQTQILPRRAGDVPYLVADATLAGLLLGWQPEQSSINRIVEDAWFFYQHINKQKKHFSYQQHHHNVL